MPASTFFRDAVCNVLRGTGITAITGWVALFNGNPSSGGTEVTTQVRVAGRVQVNFQAPSNGVMASVTGSPVDFGPSANATTVSHFAIMNASTAGNQIFWAALTNGTQNISATNPVSFAGGAIQVTVT